MIGIKETPCILRLCAMVADNELADAAIYELEQIQAQRDDATKAANIARDGFARLSLWIEHWYENGWVEDELKMAIDGEDAPADHERGRVHFDGEDKGGS
jgi:hypothetical protein